MSIQAQLGILWLLVTALSGHWLHAGPALTLYVSPSGGAGGDGTRERPFHSLESARDAVRARRQGPSLPEGEIVVTLLPGDYGQSLPFELAAEDSGTPSSPLVFRASKPGESALTGAAALSGWRPVTDPAVLSRLAPESRAHVVCIDLPESAPDPAPGFANGGCGYRWKPEYPIALFQDGERLPVSRWPNGAYAKMGKCVGHHEERGHVGTVYTEGVFEFDSDRLERWAGEPDAWFDGLWFHHWADTKMRLKTIDLKARTIALANPEYHTFGFKTGQQFFAFNLIGEIDRPGEWAIDRASRRIYLWPERDPEGSPIRLAAADHLITLTGVKHVRFQGLALEGCRETAVVAKNCESLTISGSTLRHIGSWGIEIDGGRDCAVIGCDLYDLGGGGITVAGGVRDSLEPGNHLIENNHIHHFGQIVSTYQPGAAVHGVGNRIRHNLIHDALHQAIFFQGNDHLIEYNIVHDVCLHSSDAGAIYACARDWSRRGTIIRHNLFHALGEGLDGTGCRAIYLDDMTSGTIVQSNIVTMSDCGLNFGGGQDNLVTDNVAINCKSSIQLASRGTDSFARPNAEKGRESAQYKLLLREEELFRGDLWSKRYPRLLAPMKLDPIDAQNAHFNVIRGNVNLGGGEATVRNEKNVMKTCAVEDNIDLDEDPGFVDLSALDFRLRKDSPIYGKLPDFQAPDFERMGLYENSRRASPAVKFGPVVSPLSPIMTPEARGEAERPLLVEVPPAAGPKEPAVLAVTSDPKQEPLPSRVWLHTDETHLFVAFEHTIAPGCSPTTGQVWGEDDGVEVVLGPARDERLPNRLEALVLRGYANGKVEIAEESQLVPESPGGGIVYSADHSKKGHWSAEFGIPLAEAGLIPAESNDPIFCHVTVRKPAGDQWISWRRRWSRDPADAKCACVLWLRQFGPAPFLPGIPGSAIRIDVQGDRGAGHSSMTPGDGAGAPDWAVAWNRLVTDFGIARADCWRSCRFEFSPLEDATVSLELMGTQSRPGESMAWTLYDDIRVEGAELVNGDFETPATDARVPGWKCILLGKDEAISQARAAVVGMGGEGATEGHAAMVSHDERISQRIEIKKGRKVVVNFRARAVLPGM